MLSAGFSSFVSSKRPFVTSGSRPLGDGRNFAPKLSADGGCGLNKQLTQHCGPKGRIELQAIDQSTWRARRLQPDDERPPRSVNAGAFETAMGKVLLPLACAPGRRRQPQQFLEGAVERRMAFIAHVGSDLVDGKA